MEAPPLKLVAANRTEATPTLKRSRLPIRHSHFGRSLDIIVQALVICLGKKTSFLKVNLHILHRQRPPPHDFGPWTLDSEHFHTPHCDQCTWGFHRFRPFLLPSSIFYIQFSYCLHPIKENFKSVIHGRFDTIFFLRPFLTRFGRKTKNTEFIKCQYSLIETRLFSRFSKTAKKPCFGRGQKILCL